MSTNTSAPGSAAISPVCYQIRDLIYGVAGIFHTDNRLGFLADRCGRRMKELNVPSLRQYHELLTRSASRTSEMHLLLNEITVGETCCFRNQPQLAALQRLVLPSIASSKDKVHYRHLRIWSAGCSTGEEPYTLAIILMEEASRFLQRIHLRDHRHRPQRPLAHPRPGGRLRQTTRCATSPRRSSANISIRFPAPPPTFASATRCASTSSSAASTCSTTRAWSSSNPSM